MLDIEAAKRLACAAVKTFDQIGIGQLDVEAAITTIENELDERLQLNDPVTMSKRHDFFNIPHSKDGDYSERFLSLSNDKRVLAGIRHAGGNIERPFISLWPDYELENLEDLKEVYSLLETEFAVFKPKHLSLWVNPNTKFGSELNSILTPSLRYIVGSVANIKSSKAPINRNKVKLVPIKNKDYRNWYEDLYRDFHSKFAELKDWVPVNDEEDMDSCLNDNLLFFIYIDDEKAGLIGGRKEGLLGKSGVYFTEVVLSSDYKGKGFAVAAQREFIESLSNDIELIWGTIDARNISSTKTALRVGRESIRSEFFVPVSML